jgi:Tol biopolymer transport system component
MLVAQPFSADRLRLTGSPLLMVEDIGFSPVGVAAFWVSDTGLLVFRGGSAEKTRMSWIGRDGASLGMIGKEGVYGVPRISPDGSRVAVRGRTDSGNTDIWVHEFKSGALTRLTFSPDEETFPVWSPDGRQVAFSCRGRLCRSNADGTGPLEHLTEDTVTKRFVDWSRDGRYLVYSETDPRTRGDLWILPLQKEGRPSPFLRTPFDELYGQFSPEGRWIAYTSDESGREEVYVRSFPASSGKRQISNSGGTQPRWRPDGRELFYLAGGKMMAARMRISADSIESQPPRALFPVSRLGGTFHSYDVAPDGNRFLMLQPVGGSDGGALTVFSGW